MTHLRYIKPVRYILELYVWSILTILMMPTCSEAQYYKEHYIAPASWQYWHDATEIVFSTKVDTTIKVELWKSDGNFVADFSFSSLRPAVFRPKGIFRDFPRHPLNTILDGAGMFVSGDAPFSVNVRNVASDQLGTDVYIKGNASLTSIGDPGIGIQFRIGYYRDGALPGETPIYSIMALHNETSIKINGTVVSSLNRGQSYLFRSSIGSLIESSKPCVMNTGAFLDAPGGCGDGTFDQIPPIQVLGNRYFIVRTTGNRVSEQSTIVSTVEQSWIWINRFDANGNFVSIDSVLLPTAGSYYTIQNGDGNTPLSVAEVTSDQNIAVYTGSAQSCEVDVSTSFPISSTCHGSNHIETTKFKTYRNTDLPYFCYILLENDTALVYVNGTSLETLAGSRKKIGNSGLYMITCTSGEIGNPEIITFSSPVRLHVVIIQIGGGFSMSATFSNLVEQPLVHDPIYIGSHPCPVQSAILKASSKYSSFQWYLDGKEILGANDSILIATQSGNYHVRALLECGDISESSPLTISLDTIPEGIIEETSCGPFEWLDSIYTENGVYTKAVKTEDGCDSLATLILDIHEVKTTTQLASACDHYFWTLDSNDYTVTGLYSDTLKGAFDCDSIVFLDLKINESDHIETHISTCSPYYWDQTGQYYDSSGTYSDTLTNKDGCDSVLLLHLSINGVIENNQLATTCDSFFWEINDRTIFNSGEYRDTLMSFLGCDSIIILNLKVFKSTNNIEIVESCSPYYWNTTKRLYDSSGVYTVHFLDKYGCDSSHTLELKILPSDLINLTVSDCISYLWPVTGEVYSSSGNYHHILTNSDGCDSVVSLDLVLHNHIILSDTQRNCDSYTWDVNGNTYRKSGQYDTIMITKHGCDSIRYLHLTIDEPYLYSDTVSALDKYYWPVTGQTYTEPGVYKECFISGRGCDSLHILVLTIRKRGRVFIPNVFTPNEDGINDRFVIHASPEIKLIKELQIYDRWGELVFEQYDFPSNVEIYGWDGSFRGEMLNPAVFTYVAVWIDNEGDHQKRSGDVTLLK